MSLPSAFHKTQHVPVPQLEDASVHTTLSAHVRSMVDLDADFRIPPLLNSLHQHHSMPAQVVEKKIGTLLGHAVLVWGIAVRALLIKSNIMCDLIHHVVSAISCKTSLAAIARKFGYVNGREHFTIEIARLCVRGDTTFEGVGLALGNMLRPIIVSVTDSVRGLLVVPANGRRRIRVRHAAEALPWSAPVHRGECGGQNLEAHHRLMAIIWEFEMYKPFISIMVPWRRIYEVNLSSDLGRMGQFFGDAVYNLTVLRVLWEYRQNITAGAFCNIYQYLISNSVMDIVTPLFDLNASFAFADNTETKSRGDFLESALGLSFIERKEFQGNSQVLATTYSIVRMLVEECIKVWSS